MKPVATLWFAIVFAQIGLAGCSRAADISEISECSETQLLGYVPTADELTAHRKFRLPTITYPYGHRTEKGDPWGFMLRVRVDPGGNVTCYSIDGRWGSEVSLNEQRRSLIAELRQWRYQPFLREGTAVDAIVAELIREEEAPAGHQPLPEVPIERVQIGLERTACFGSCPIYKVEVYGDGRVVYDGEGFVDVIGKHAYRIAPERVAKLVESLRSTNIWSLREEYQAPITDSPSYLLTLRFGEQVHRLADYVGDWVGMPQSVTDFENEIDEVSEATGFINLSRGAVERLRAEGFEFRSQAGANLLARAVSNRDSHDTAAMLQLIELGAPIVGAKVPDGVFWGSFQPLLEEALINQRLELIDPLIERGALQTQGAPDQSKIDAAFRAAVQGGRLQSIEKIWAIAARMPHPSLTFVDVTDEDDRPVKKTAPVTLLLRRPFGHSGAWEGLAVAKWLAARGCDIKAAGADGTTLLHIAAEAGDVDFVRYLLSQGFDASTPGRYELPALGSTHSEDVALLLLQAGTDLTKMDDSGQSFRRFAVENHWARVIAWLDAH